MTISAQTDAAVNHFGHPHQDAVVNRSALEGAVMGRLAQQGEAVNRLIREHRTADPLYPDGMAANLLVPGGTVMNHSVRGNLTVSHLILKENILVNGKNLSTKEEEAVHPSTPEEEITTGSKSL